MTDDSALRHPIPIIPPDWDTLTKPCNIVFGCSYSHYPLDQVSSSLQKAIRRGFFWDACKWALEMYYTGPNIQTNLWNRLMVMAMEDVGLGSPLLIIMVQKIYNMHPNATGVLMVVMYLCYAKKCRANDWLICIYNENSVNQCKNAYTAIQLREFLMRHLRNKDAMNAMYIILVIGNTDLKENGKRLDYITWDCFNDYYKEMRQEKGNRHSTPSNDSAPVSRLPGLNPEFLISMRELSESANWKTSGKRFLVYAHCLHILLFDMIPDSETFNKVGNEIYIKFHDEFTIDQLKRIEALVKNRLFVIGVPDYAVDKHTRKGKSMNRGLKHFVEIGGMLNNVDEQWRELDQKYLNIMISARTDEIV